MNLVDLQPIHSQFAFFDTSYLLEWFAMCVSNSFHSAQPVAPLFRLRRGQRMAKIDLATDPASWEAVQETCLSTDPLTPAIVDPISCDRSTRQVLSIVYPGGIEENTILLGGQPGPIHPSVVPAHEDDEILVRDTREQPKWFSPAPSNHRRAYLEHSSFIRSVPVILAAIALLFAGSSPTRIPCGVEFDSSGSQITISIPSNITAASIDLEIQVGSRCRPVIDSTWPAGFRSKRSPDLEIQT